MLFESLTAVIVLLASLAAGTYAITSTINTRARLRHVPGPVIAGISKIWLVRHVASGRLCRKLESVTKQYGPLVRIGPNVVCCSDVDEIRRIWHVRSGYYRSDWYRAIRINAEADNVLTVTENKAHHSLRSKIMPAYAGKGLENEEEIVDRQILKLIDLIERKYISTSRTLIKCNLARIMQYLTSDVVSAIGFGKAAGYLEADEDIFGLIKSTEALFMPVDILTVVYSMRRILENDWFKQYLPKPTQDTGIGRFLKLIKTHVDSHYEKRVADPNVQHNRDMLDSFIAAGLPYNQVEAESFVMLFAGTDTTSTALRNTIFFLSANPVAYRRLQQEIDTAYAPMTQSTIITDKNAKALPYLQACIRESMRLWPPSMGLMGKVRDQPDMICGLMIPAHTEVTWAALPIMKDARVFGQDADVFEPGRWLNVDPERFQRMQSVYSLVFATGTRWECLGKRLAYIELGKVLFELFRRYDFAMVNPVEPFKWKTHGLTAQSDMHVKITKRDGPTPTGD